MSRWLATARVPAEVIMAEGMRYAGDVHVQNSVPHRHGPETALEMLNRRQAIFPLSLADGGVVFLAKAQVAVLSCDPPEPMFEPERASVATRMHLHVIMVGGAEFIGWAQGELPPSRGRALDFLNGPDDFFSLQTDGTMRCLHRTFVRAVTPLD
ncbi:MAG TPA: hypothetical protein VFL95_04040 [Gemmatimonadales bacterium]|nr:hypothetical protein [Gemmatimonadales bacterium]